MERERMDPRLLNAFADGELEPEAAAKVVMHLADCPEDQATVDAIMVMNALLAQACAGPMREPVPPAIRAAIFGAAPVAARGRARVAVLRRPGVRAAVWGGALAAGIAAAVVLVPLVGRDAAGFELALGPVPERSPVAEALTELASGETQMVARDVELAMTASYAVPGGYCREFALSDAAGGPDLAALACREDRGWRVAAREAVPDPDEGTRYVPAGGEDDDAIRASLDTRGAGLALSAAEEAKARAAGWR